MSEYPIDELSDREKIFYFDQMHSEYGKLCREIHRLRTTVKVLMVSVFSALLVAAVCIFVAVIVARSAS